MARDKGLDVVVVGGGPIGLLAAMYAAQRGHNVEIYELRSDPRLQSSRANQGKSIQLTLTRRGIQALEGFDNLLSTVIAQAMPVEGRVLHEKSKSGDILPAERLYGTSEGHILHCICRQELQEILLEAACRMPNVTVSFECKIEDVDFERKVIHIRKTGKAEGKSMRTYDLLLGADGAHSAVRKTLARRGFCREKETLPDCLWTEFLIPAAQGASYKLSPKRLHIWPAQKSMFIAMPKSSGDFIVTWFAPFDHFTRLDKMTEKAMLLSIESLHPGIFQVLDRSVFSHQIRNGSRQNLIGVTSSSYHWNDSVVLVGDAANTIVPFYGQGTNSGFESVQLLWETIDNAVRLDSALASYSLSRIGNLHCISDLAWEHFKELRGNVPRIEKTWRSVEAHLAALTGSITWASEYSLVAFSELQYSEVRRCVSMRRWKVIQLLLLVVVVMVVIACTTTVRMSRRQVESEWSTSL